jgi:hypothetical protein
MADWQTISALATAGGTLVLAAATFSAVRSSNRSARVAERALLAGMRPVLVPSLSGDADQKVVWRDQHVARVGGGRAIAEHADGNIYLAISLRNVGAGLALLHGWYPRATVAYSDTPHAEIEEFRRLTVDLYVAPNGPGYWEGAIRDDSESLHGEFMRVVTERQPFTIELLYGDQEGGQRTISRCLVMPASDGAWFSQIARHWNVDRADPR